MKTYLNLCQSGVKSVFATCQLIKYIVDILKKGEIDDSKTLSVIISLLRHTILTLNLVFLKLLKNLLY